jgi:hypothetical protein
MRLGLITDVHNHVAQLRRALELFRIHDVEQVVTIGDTCDAFAPAGGAAEVVALLSNCGAVGVWGNHDIALCRNAPDRYRTRFGAEVLEFMGRMRPSLELGGCHFSHKDASVDAQDALQLWSLEEEPLDLLARATAGFTAVRHARQFVGHYHRWWAATPQGRIDWDGSRPLILRPGERYFVVVAAVFQGWCAVLDTVSGVMHPLPCGAV